jgi:hypothetical protein
MALTANQVSEIIETEFGKIKNPQALELIRTLLLCDARIALGITASRG